MARAKIQIKGVKQLNKRLKRLAKEMGYTERDITLDIAKSACRRLTSVTYPRGTNGKARLQGENSIRRDFNKTYVVDKTIYFKLKAIDRYVAFAYSRLIEKKQYGEASTLASRYINTKSSQGTFDGGTLHQKNRQRRGRVGYNPRTMMVEHSESLNGYKSKRILSVGKAKSGWANAAQSLPVTTQSRKPRYSAWLSKRHGNTGRGWVSRRGFKTTVHVVNSVKYASDTTLSGYIRKAQKDGYMNVFRKYNRVVEKMTKKI